MDSVGLILAAGFSRRFGPADKRLHELTIDGSTRPMLAHTVARFCAVFSSVVVVVRPNDAAVAALVSPHPATLVEAECAHDGMGHSLAAGACAVPGNSAVFVGHGDMPFIAAATLKTLASHPMAHDSILQPTYAGEAGHPVAFGPRWLAELRRLTGDAGARAIVRAHRRCLTQVPVTDPGILRDVDTPEAAAP